MNILPQAPGPSSSLSCTRSSFSPLSSSLSRPPLHSKWVNEHWFNYSVDIVIPNISETDKTNIINKINQNYYYSSPSTSLLTFISPEFITNYIKNGKFYAISTNTHIGGSQMSAAVFDGKLEIVVDKSLYEEFGLVGTASEFPPRVQPSFMPGRKFYDRVKWCLERVSELSFLFSFVKDGRSASIEFLKDKPHQQIPLTVEETKKDRVITPSLSSISSLPDEDLDSFLYAFHSWAEFIATDILPQDMSEEGFPIEYSTQSVTTLTWRGLIPPEFIQHLLDLLRKQVKTFGVVSVMGFEDSPVSWGNKEHKYENSGENSYSFVVLPNDEYWFFLALGPCDKYK